MRSTTVILTCLAMLLAGTQAAAASKQEQQAEVRSMVQRTLQELYKAQPKARQAIAQSAGYAVFSNFGTKILVAGGGSGSGVAINQKTNAETFMKMVEVQAGIGLRITKYRLVWVFERQSDLDKFVNSGWEIGGQATASGKLSGQGMEAYTGAMSITPGVWLYQLSDDGLAVDLTAKGTKYYKDSKLN